jgi:hypothetical protein
MVMQPVRRETGVRGIHTLNLRGDAEEVCSFQKVRLSGPRWNK